MSKKDAVARWDEELAQQAKEAAAIEESATMGEFLSLKGGILSFQKVAVENNQLPVIIVAHRLENVYYDQDFDPDNPAPPRCFAFGTKKDDMAPHPEVVAANHHQNDVCAGCYQNTWGSSTKSARGKACSNTRRLALLIAGQLDKAGKKAKIGNAEYFEECPIVYLKMPVLSVADFSAYVKKLNAGASLPPHGVISRLHVVPDAKAQFKALFSALLNLPASIGPAVIKRYTEAQASIEFPYPVDVEPVQPARAAGGGRKKAGAKKKAPAKGKGGKKAGKRY